MEYIIITFATEGDKYEKYAENFRKNMTDLGISHVVEIILPIISNEPNDRLLDRQRKKKDTGMLRPIFLREMLEKYKTTLMWIDVDDGLTGVPELPDHHFDVGFCNRLGKYPSNTKLKITASPLVIRPTENTYHFLSVWEYLNNWPELEPIGGSHIRLDAARYICFENDKNPMNFKQENLSEYILPHLQLNKNKG